MITISLCMIVKDEEKILKRCLDSVADLVDEIIIVDTGSSDNTKEIGQLYTKNIYDFVWQDDFSKARNYAFSKATKEYIYTVDVDEVLDDENREKFKILKEALCTEVEIVQMKYANQLKHGTVYNFNVEYRPKLFKRLRTFEWMDPIHETIRLEPIIYDSDVVILHMPLENHGKRDFNIFLKNLEMGVGLSRKMLHMYALELLMVGEVEDVVKAEPFILQVLKEFGRSEEELVEAFCIAIRAARFQHKLEDLLKYTTKALGLKECSEVYFELGAFYEEEKEYEEAILWYYNSAFETTPILCRKLGEEEPLRGLCRCYTVLGMEEQVAIYEKEIDERREKW